MENGRSEERDLSLLCDEARRALDSAPFRGAPLVCKTLKLLLRAAEEGSEPLTSNELADMVYADASDADLVRKTVERLRHNLNGYYMAEGSGSARTLSVTQGPYRLELRSRTEASAGAELHTEAASAASQPAAPLSAHPPTSWPRPRVVQALSAVALGGILFAFLFWALWPSSPAGVRCEGHSLIAVDEDGEEIWRHRFERRLSCDDLDLLDRYTALDDYDGDGRNEIAVIPPFASEGCSGLLLLFDDDGTRLWEKYLGRGQEFGGRMMPDCYDGLRAESLGTAGSFPGTARVLAVAADDFGDYCRVVALDLNGAVLREFWNVGHLPEFVWWDADGDERQEVVLAGPNNEYGDAVVVVLDPRDFGGGSPQTPGTQYCSNTLPAGRFVRYVRIPGDKTLLQFNRTYVSEISAEGDYLKIFIAVTRRASLSYLCDRAFECQVRPSDEYRKLFEKARQEGRIPWISLSQRLEGLAREVLIWDGKEWVSAGPRR